MEVTVFYRPLPDGAECGARGALLSAALGEGRAARLLYAPGGKPFIAPAADDPRPPYMSLTHTRALIACAVCRAPVGLDAEPAERAVPEALARRILSAAERARCAALPEGARAAFLLDVWVAKEAHLKRTGEGLAGGMARLTVAPGGRVLAGDGRPLGHVRPVALPGARAAVAAQAAAHRRRRAADLSRPQKNFPRNLQKKAARAQPNARSRGVMGTGRPERRAPDAKPHVAHGRPTSAHKPDDRRKPV